MSTPEATYRMQQLQESKDPIYGHVDSPLEDDAKQVVDPGTICFWVEGSSIAIPFGPTPISEGDECRLATAVNTVGMCDGDPRVLASVKDGDRILVEEA